GGVRRRCRRDAARPRRLGDRQATRRRTAGGSGFRSSPLTTHPSCRAGSRKTEPLLAGRGGGGGDGANRGGGEGAARGARRGGASAEARFHSLEGAEEVHHVVDDLRADDT